MMMIPARVVFKTPVRLALPLAQIPCCSSIALPSIMNLQTRSFALIPFKNNQFCLQMLLSSSRNSSTGQSLNEKSQGKPQIYQLEHIQKRLEFTVPLMFKLKLDYSFYRKDVILEDQILNITQNGLHDVMRHMAFISFIAHCWRPYAEAEIINITPILEDGTVRLRWRIKYLKWFQSFNRKSNDKEWINKNAKWFDGYSIFYADGEGLVYKCTLQKTMPDESSLMKMKDKTKEFVRRVVVSDQTATFTQKSSTDADHDIKIKYFKKTSSLTERRRENNNNKFCCGRS